MKPRGRMGLLTALTLAVVTKQRVNRNDGECG